MKPVAMHMFNHQAVLLVLLAAFAAGPAQAQMSVFADPKAGVIGDLVTVVLVERTSAHRQSNWNNQSNAGIGAGADVSSSDLSGRFALDANFNKEARNRNSSSQEDLLQGTITARVIEVDPAGNLVIEGERRLSVNGETHLLRVSGIVRPIDVRSNNSVRSPDIANADIEYRRSGIHRRWVRPAFFVRAGVVAVLAAAIALGS